MTMAMISPSRREVSPAEQLCRSPRLVPPRGGGVSSRKLAYDFSSDERLHIVEDGHRRANRGPTRQNLGGTNLGLWQSCSPGETSLREGEIIAIVITNDPLIGRGSISINIFTSTISSKTLVHLFYPIFVSKPQIGTCRLLVVLITPCSSCYLVYLVEDHMFRSFMHIITPLIMNMNMLCE